MNNNENNNSASEIRENRPRRHGPGGMRGPAEKPKDFKSAMKRLFSELKDFKTLIAISLILAALGSILSISAPNRLSKLTDEISKGLVVNTDNMQELVQKTAMNMAMQNFEEIEIDGVKISTEDQKVFLEKLNEINGISEMMSSSQSANTDTNAIATQVTNGDINSSSEENKATDISEASVSEETSLISNIDANELYKKIDEMPESVRSVIEPKMNMSEIKKITIFLACLYICSALFTYIQGISMTDVANKFAKKLRSRISGKINKLPLKYFDKHQTGDILSRVTNDVDTIAQSMNQSLATLVSSVTLFLGTILMMFYTNWIMALTAIISSLLGFVFMFAVLKKSQKYFVARQVELGNLNSHIEEVYSGLNVVKVYNGKKESDKKFDELNRRVYDCNRKSQFLSGLMQPMMNFIGNFGYVAVCIVGALLTMNDVITFGTIIAFITYVRLFTSPLSQIAQATTSLQSTAAASERVFEFLDEEEMPSQENVKKHLDAKKVKGRINFENVEFYYDGNEKPTIKNFTASAKPGQKIAIVGPTGAGKTTMVNLLMKFYEINSGDIKIDGVSTKDLSRENIHDLFTMVLQDTWLFEGTIKENIIYNRDHITNKDVERVCDTVGLTHFIKTLPHGLNSKISDNDNISAGQKQLLTIARAMLDDAPFLILDEATSNVDTRTEELVQKAMDKLTEKRTSFIIAHRLSTIKNADLILVMQHGNIVEQGNHEELMKKNGVYAELYNSQFEKVG
jgi:ATP-binding cassette subfamily B protein